MAWYKILFGVPFITRANDTKYCYQIKVNDKFLHREINTCFKGRLIVKKASRSELGIRSTY